MATAKHQRAGAIECVEQSQCLAFDGCGERRQEQQQREEQNDCDDSNAAMQFQAEWYVIGVGGECGLWQQRQARDRSEHDGSDLADR